MVRQVVMVRNRMYSGVLLPRWAGDLILFAFHFDFVFMTGYPSKTIHFTENTECIIFVCCANTRDVVITKGTHYPHVCYLDINFRFAYAS